MALPNTQPPITEADLIAVLTQEQYSHLEIVNGEWVGGKEAPMTGEEHGAIAMELATLLNLYVKQNNLGRVYPADLIYVLNGDEDDIRVVRKTNISFVTAERVKTHDRSKPYYQAPDLAIEIVSPSETIETTRAKLNDYLDYGTQQVWVVYPQTKQVEIYLPDGTARTYNADDTLSGGDLLPGFTLSIQDIFNI